MSAEDINNKKVPLINQIMSFRKWRNWVAVPFVAVGVAGLALPLLPGIAIIFLGVALLNPEWAKKIKNSISRKSKDDS